MKTLIFFEENQLKPVGGPSGYLYNIKTERDKLCDTEIDFLNANNTSISLFRKLLDLGYRGIESVFRKKFIRLRQAKYIYYKSKRKSTYSINDYDIIHFHGTADMYSQKKALEQYHGIVVLTSHSPKVFYREFIEDYMSQDEYLQNKHFFDGMEEIDEYAFRRADYVIFPCEGAEEPYYHTWEKYVQLRSANKIKYLPTGINRESFKLDRENVRKKYDIPEEAFVLSFVGRHNEVKGYDILIELFNKFDDIYVLCCGNKGDIECPKSDRWIEVGWTNDPYSYVNASDLYMLPNRETYFDLALLQTISIGKTALISDTGGNKQFVNEEDRSIYIFQDIDDAVEKIKKIKSITKEQKKEQELKQRQLFATKYAIDVFYAEYKKLLHEVEGTRIDEK